MSAYRVCAPYVTLRVKDQNGQDVLLGYYEGAVIKDPVQDMQFDKHLNQGMIEKLPDDEADELERTETETAEAEQKAREAAEEAREAELTREREAATAAREAAGVQDDDYPDKTLGELREELAGRGQPTSGNKPELIARLRAHDAAEADKQAAEARQGQQ